MAKTATNTKKKTDTKKKPASSKAKAEQPTQKKPIRREVTAIVFAFLALLVIIGLFVADGFAVSALCNLLKGLFGYGFWICAPAFILVTAIMGFHRGRPVTFRFVCALLLPLFFGTAIDLLLSKTIVSNLNGITEIITTLYTGGKALTSGGVLCGLLSYGCEKAFSIYGAAVIVVLLFILTALNALGITARKLIEWLGERNAAEYEPEKVEEKPELSPKLKKEAKRRSVDIPFDDEPIEPIKKNPIADEKTVLEMKPSREEQPSKDEKSSKLFGRKKQPTIEIIDENSTEDVEPVSIEEAEKIAGIVSSDAGVKSEPKKRMSASALEEETKAVANEIRKEDPDSDYEKPPIYLLKKGHATAINADEELRINRERLEGAIKSFGVNAKIVATTHGPTVTRYDLELEQGVKLNRLTNLAGDIALALGVVSVRIAPIPDKISTVGIEVPNKLISTVYLRDIIDSRAFSEAKAELSFAIGKDIAGDAVVGNISKLPHLLIAGTTGSGKSVCMNSLIISLLYRCKPEDLRLIMIDPKMVELGVYNGIPHLYIPVVTDPKKAAGALQWTVTEMLKRYRLFSEIGVRSLSAYNEHLEANGQPKMPNVVVVVDELADLMLVASKEVEESICRVAQMGRAAGMHLVIATQRPSADVITGLMKANIPSRIAFAVSSAMESRIILDNSGAEKLIGMGDMLYAPLGCGKPLRVQGAFVSDEEREEVIGFIKEQSKANYSEDIIAQIEKAAEEKSSSKGNDEPEEAGGKTEFDELLPQAVDVIFDTKQASVSMLQRRLKLGYSRAARIIDQMEEMGIVGPFEGSKPRQLLITREQWLEMQTTQGTAPTEILQTSIDFQDEINSDE